MPTPVAYRSCRNRHMPVAIYPTATARPWRGRCQCGLEIKDRRERAVLVGLAGVDGAALRGIQLARRISVGERFAVHGVSRVGRTSTADKVMSVDGVADVAVHAHEARDTGFVQQRDNGLLGRHDPDALSRLVTREFVDQCL